jgi:hypothetical protein
MNALDIAYCLDRADTRDPFRRDNWYDAFLDAAYELGYRIVDGESCHCHDPMSHDPDCGMVRRMPFDRRVWPWDDNPPGQEPMDLDGLMQPAERERGWVYHPRRMDYFHDPDGWHRHQCCECGTIWLHRDANPADPPVPGYHECPKCPHGESESYLFEFSRYVGKEKPTHVDLRYPADILRGNRSENNGSNHFRHLRELVNGIASSIADVIDNSPANPAGEHTESFS